MDKEKWEELDLIASSTIRLSLAKNILVMFLVRHQPKSFGRNLNGYIKERNDITDSEMHVTEEVVDVENDDVDCGNDNVEFIWEREITSGVKERRNMLVKGDMNLRKKKKLRKGDVLGFTFDPIEDFLYGFQGSRG
ncbi:hypothetical protein KIW84_058033 [Lathyrus oleraceus]|uniref:Uncharacterized protein n=1 Tax=Pisum sativum TaxID=3888 RepID=A0A9D4X7N3_PEA|nr:hypothetical protein KIW84_058033 [Pisum sativum]